MTPKDSKGIVRYALWFAPIAIIPIAFFASIPWLKEQSDAVTMGIAAVAALFVMGYSIFLSERANRHLDEVEIAGQRFAQTKGMTIGSVAAVVVMVIPAAMNVLVDLANNISSDSPDEAVKLGIVFGFIMVILLQTLGTVVANFWWKRRIGGEG